MRKKISIMFFILMIIVFPAFAQIEYFGKTPTAVVYETKKEIGNTEIKIKKIRITSPNGVNIREKADSFSNQIGKANKNDIFSYAGAVGGTGIFDDSGWYKIRYNETIAYVPERMILPENVPVERVKIISNKRVNVRNKPSADSKQIGWAYPSIEYPYLGTINNWICIDFDGKIGYVSSKLASVVTDNGANYIKIINQNIIDNFNKSSMNRIKVNQDDIFLSIEEYNGKYKFLLDGKAAYISSDHTQLVD